ncbi:MAG TPA: MFS transporter, partial [Anaerolineae bacterium]|nr:MFS transporter [Anaerolineae bacterium]
SRRTLMGIYILVSFLYGMCLYLYMPTLPTYVQSKSEDLAQVGVILAQYGLWQAIVRWPLGMAADWVGRRKPFIFAGLVLCAVSAWMTGAAQDAQGLLIGRALTGVAASTWVPMTVLFSSLFPPREAVRATSILTATISVGRMVGTSSTGTLNGIGGYPLAFYVAAGVGAAAALVLLLARETPHAPRPPSFQATGRILTRRDVMLPALLSAVGQYATWAVPFGFLPILADQLGATPVAQSMMVTFNILLFTLGGLVAAALANRIGAGKLVRFAFVLLALGIAVAALAGSLATIWVAHLFIGIALGISYPVLMGLSIREVAEIERSTAMGLHQAVYAAGMFAGPWLSGILADALGLRPMLGATAFAVLALGTVLARGCKDR